MTLVACLKGQDGLVLAADSRGTIGDPRELTAINDSHTKLFGLSKFVGIVAYGQAELAAQLIAEVKHELPDTDVYFDLVFQKARQLIRDKYINWFKDIPRDHRQALGFIVGGFEESAEAKIYYLQSPLDFAPQLVTTGIALGGIPQYATYLVHRLYDPGMSISNLFSLAAYIISETATQDPKVGGPVRMAQITSDKGYVQLSEDEVTEIIKHNDELNTRLRDFFFTKEGDTHGQ